MDMLSVVMVGIDVTQAPELADMEWIVHGSIGAVKLENVTSIINSKAIKEMISGAQLRAARAFIGWTARALATKAAVPLFTIEWIEGEGKITGKDLKHLAAMGDTLEAAGIEFTADDGVQGVRLHPNSTKRRRASGSRTQS
jgi:NaMN:DMB phosphoribosyltransferase